jgi:hypothetical protein
MLEKLHARSVNSFYIKKGNFNKHELLQSEKKHHRVDDNIETRVSLKEENRSKVIEMEITHRTC